MKHINLFITAIGFVVILTACNNNDPQVSEDDTEVNVGIKEAEDEVLVQLKNNEGATVGTAVLVEGPEGVKISVHATHLSPGTHGFHIHEKGICEEPTFESAEGHFNPDGKNHGFDHPDGPHAGDLPNLEINEDGAVQQEVIAEKVTLNKADKYSLISGEGTTLIIHEDPDDGKSQPAGNAGNRIVCGVISN